VLEKPGAEKELALVLEPEPVIITEVAGNDRMIEGLPGDEAFELMPGVQALKKQADWAIQYQYPQHQ
jgi:hypothetical protein